MKKKVLSVFLVVALVAITAMGTLAYFTDTDDAENVFTVGNVSIELTEPNWDSEGVDDAPEVYPGEALAKDPTVTNDGDNPCFVRVKVEGLDCLGENNVITTRYKYVDGYNTTDWELYNGYYYYKGVLAVDEVTNPVFDQIVIPTTLTNGDGTTEYSIDIYAEAVQAQGAKPSFTDVKAMTVAEIAAWFATCGM